MISYQKWVQFRNHATPSEVGIPLPVTYSIKSEEDLELVRRRLLRHLTLEERTTQGYGKNWQVTLLPKAYRNFLYRGEKGDATRLSMQDIFDKVVENGGIGQHSSSVVPTSWDPTSALASANINGGVWLIYPNALRELRTGYGYTMFFDEEEICFKELIPLHLIRYLITSKENRQEILRKHRTTALFGTPLRNFIIGVPGTDEDFTDYALDAIIRANLRSRLPVDIDARDYAYSLRNPDVVEATNAVR